MATLASFVEAERHSRLYTGGKVQASSCGTYIVCPCGPELNVIDITSGKVRLTVPADGDEFTAFALRPLGDELVTAGRSRQLRSWSIDPATPTCECLRVWKAHKMPVLDLAYEGTGTLVASGSADTTVMVFDVAKGYCTHVFRGHEGTVHLVTFHPDAARLQLLSAASDNVIRV